MELTPEEREKIFAEEKTRFEVRQQLEQEAERARLRNTVSKCGICGAVIRDERTHCPDCDEEIVKEDTTPRERENIVTYPAMMERGTRLDVRDVSGWNKKSHRLRNTLIAVAAYVVFLVAVSYWLAGLSSTPGSSSGESAQTPSEPTDYTTMTPAPVSPPASDARFEACKKKLKKAQQIDLLSNLEMQGYGAHVVVGPTFYTIPFDAKEGFAETVNCFLMAGAGGGMAFDLRDWRTDEVVAHWNGYKLVMRR